MSLEADRIVLHVRGGARLAVPAQLQITTYVLLEQEDWFEDEIRFVRGWLRPGMRAIDAGAAFGVYTVAIAKAVGDAGRVWAFEPTQRTAEFLQFNLELNQVPQVKLVRAALSDRAGKMRLALGRDAETNSIAEAGDASGDTVEVDAISLDQAAAELGWAGIDFIKIDIEGHELAAIEGGAGFLRSNSPLIMLEVRGADGEPNFGALDRLAEMGYQPYRLLPGPLVLTPFDGELEPGQLNLFACRQDRARALAAQGALMEADAAELPSPPAAAWAAYVAGAPYARAISSRWPSPPAREEQDEYFTALAAFAQSRLATRASADHIGWLNYALQSAARALGSADTPARRMTYARLAWELGSRTEAVDALKRAAEDLARNGAAPADEPFLAPSPRYERVPAEPDPAGWMKCAVVEQHERLRQYSSCFGPSESLPNIESIIHLPQRSPEMDRRRQLARLLTGAQAALKPEPPLLIRSEENLNPEFWSTAVKEAHGN
jgi:FkbM family methyltransferase